MKLERFLNSYLEPSEPKLKPEFKYPLPAEGLKQTADFIVQCHKEDTYSTNILFCYESSALGIRMCEVYKNTENRRTGNFIRLVGTMALLKKGYPRLILDGAIYNVNTKTGEKDEPSTQIVVGLGMATPEQQRVFFSRFNEGAGRERIAYTERVASEMPPFWGPMWRSQTTGVQLDTIRQLRDLAWGAYSVVLRETPADLDIRYRPLYEHSIFEIAGREHGLFARCGLSVPTAAQSAFFAAMNISED